MRINTMIYSQTGSARGFYLAIVILLLGFNAYAQNIKLRINEFMALNSTILIDEDGEYSDWIEVYNPSSEAINLQDYSLTDDSTDISKWLFPDITLEPNSFLLIYASGKDRAVSGSELHTNFKLSGAGEYLGLFSPGGVAITVFEPEFPEQCSDLSFGYYDGGYVAFAIPTPGEENTTEGGVTILAPKFSHNHGYYDSAFVLKITSPLTSSSIYYTTDGSMPSATNGILYQDSIVISETTVLRAVIVLDENESEVVTQSYFFVEDIIHQPNNPEGYPSDWGSFTTLSGSVPADYEIDPEMVADPVFAETLKKALKDIPTISLVTDKNNFFSHEVDENTGGIYVYTGAPLTRTTYDTGRGWVRPVSAELFNTEDSTSFQVDCGISINGGHSRRPEKNNKHSFRLYFKSEYGPTRLRYPIFGDSAASNFNALILRAEFGNSWMHQTSVERERGTYQRDTWGKDTHRAMGHPSSNARYVNLYINGIYWGMYVIAERMDNEFAASYIEGDAEDFDVIKDYSEVMDGTGDAWEELLQIVNQGVTDEVYHRLQGNNPDGTPNAAYKPLINMDNFIDYMLINFYGSNTDWDHHNWAAMNNHNKRGKGFHFMMWDGEHLVKDVNNDILSENNSGCPSNIFQQLRENGLFRRHWADRVQKHFYNNGVLTSENASRLWQKRKAQIELAINGEAARWGDYRRDVFSWTTGPYELYTKETHWDVQQDFMLNTYFPERGEVFVDQMREVGLMPSIDAPVLTLNNITTKGENIQAGDVLKMQSDEGVIYYTLDGTDPAGDNAASLTTETLIDAGAEKYVVVPHINLGSNWKNVEYLPSGWISVSGLPGGVGYENGSGYESFISLDVKSDMSSTYSSDPNNSCYMRIAFNLEKETLDKIGALTLKMLFDDGFVAYLNGTEVASENAPSELAYNSSSAGGHEAEVFESFNITAFIELLKEGSNVLAIHGLNEKTTSSDFMQNAILEAGLLPDDIEEKTSLVYSDPLILEQSTHVKARAFANNEWSPLCEAYFAIPSELENIRITEVHYHPLPNDTIDGDKYEFLELKNIGESILNLSGVQLVKGVEYTFAENTYLAPDSFIVLVADEEDYLDRYGLLPFDDYKGQLDNNGERILLVDSEGDTLSTIRYYDTQPWPVLADAGGYSLVPTKINPDADQDSSVYWRLSHDVGGSPGKDDIYSSVDVAEEISADKRSVISNCYPNPFNNYTQIDIRLYEESYVQARVYDLFGKLVCVLADGRYYQDSNSITWNGTNSSGQNVPSGVYLIKVSITTGTDELQDVRRVVYTK